MTLRFTIQSFCRNKRAHEWHPERLSWEIYRESRLTLCLKWHAPRIHARRLIYRNFTTILLTYILLHKSDTCALTCSDRMSLKSEKLSREIEEAMRPEAYMKWPTIATWPKYYRDNFFEVVYFRRRIKTRILFGVPREITLFYVLFTLLYYPNKTVWKL
jgi:hypothetical protein